MTEKTNKILLEEDWASVVLGFGILLVSLLWFVLPTPTFSWKSSAELTQNVLSVFNLAKIAGQFAFLYVFSSIGVWLSGRNLRSFLAAFPLFFLLTAAALIMAGNSQMKAINLEAVIFCLLIGLLISNTTSLPEWFREALSTELFVKTGLVLLGAGVIFTDILKAGSLGLIQSLVVVFSVWYLAYWVCKRFKIDEEMTMMIASAVSICGVSAAIATAGAIKGDPKKLSYVVSLVLIIAIPMMIFMPYIANYFQFPEAVTGAWLGGSIDTTGAVVASGTLVGETALKISTIVKFSQNVLLGLAAFFISVYWTYIQKDENGNQQSRPTLKLIWDRFPKFVLGFIATSVVFSFFISPEVLGGVKDSLKSIQSLWFALAFTCIGLETKFSDLWNEERKKPLYAFLIAQGFNILITLVMAFLLFS